MIHCIRRTLPLALALTAMTAPFAQAQYFQARGFSVSVGATGQFSTLLETNPASSVSTTTNVQGTPEAVRVSNQQQYTTMSAGFLTSTEFHPRPWAGLEFNYGYTHYQERYGYSLGSSGSTTILNPSAVYQKRITTDMHEATGAYQFHPKHIPFQPFVNIGGGAVDFAPRQGYNQWRGAGLLEAGFDLPVHLSHVGFRVEGRTLYYRSPNFYQPSLSTRSWRVTEEPSLSAYYRF